MGYPPSVRYDNAIPDHRAALAGMDHDVSLDSRPGPQTASIRDTVAALLEIGLPMTAKGPLIRRRPVVAMSERFGIDRTAIKRAQRLRRKYAPGPLLLQIPVRRMALVLDPGDVHRILHGEQHPFSPNTAEKRMGLPHFEPNVSLISDGSERVERRSLSESVLQMEQPAHTLAPQFLRVLDQEVEAMISEAQSEGALDWYTFSERWFRMVRRITLGEGAADDEKLGDMLDTLRHMSNMSFLAPRLAPLRDAFHDRLQGHLERAEPNTLAALVQDFPQTERTAASNQVSQWLFAFDPAAMATYRALALIANHPAQRGRALEEALFHPGEARTQLRYLRACVLESLRLWPTTPIILRETRAETQWGSGTIPADTTLVIFAPFFHRDDRRLPYAHRFEPDVFMDVSRQREWPLVPFSGGPGICPGQNLVLLLSSALLATLVSRLDLEMEDAHRLDPTRDMPGILDHFSVRFAVAARDGHGPASQPAAEQRTSPEAALSR
jgi:cytochrome P450